MKFIGVFFLQSMLTESSMTTVISESVNDTEELSVSVQSDTSSCFSVSEDDSESDSEINDDFTNLYELAKSKPTIATMTKPARESTKKMRGKFGALIVKIKESMERNKKSVNDLILFLAEIETLDPVSTTVGDSCLLFNAETIREFRTECERIEDVFIRLKGYYSWFNYRLVKDIANAFCENDEKVTNELKKYKKIFKKYCQKRLCHLPDESSPPARDTQLCVFTIDADWRTMKINQVKPVKTIIRQVLGLRKITLRLRAARNGSVKLVFDIPKHVADVVFPLAENQVMSLKEHRIQFKGEHSSYTYGCQLKTCYYLFKSSQTILNHNLSPVHDITQSVNTADAKQNPNSFQHTWACLTPSIVPIVSHCESAFRLCVY